jgi:thioredoxin 1
MVGPFIEQLSEEYAGKAAVGKIDIEENDDLATKYAIRNIPTVLFFKNGQVVDKMVGAAPKSAYEEKLKSLL